MKKLYALLLSSMLMFTVSAVELEKCVIYYDKGVPPSVEKAAKELQFHLGKTIGKKIPIVHTPASPMIALGDSTAAKKAGIDTSKMDYEEYRFLTRDGNIYIVGKDLAKDGKTEYEGYSLGTYYAVFDFMENVLGISFLLPGERGIFYPELKAGYKIDKLDVKYKPQFKCRTMSGGMDQSIPQLKEWMARNHYATRWISGSARWSGGHSWGYLYPLKNHRTKVQSLVKSREETFREHPEFFELSTNGKRIEPMGDFSLCISNPAVADDIAARYRTFSKYTKSKFAMTAPNDGRPSCACKNCQAQIEILTREKTGPTGLHFMRKSWTKPVLAYYRRICEQLPDFIVNGYIYAIYEFPPEGKIGKMPKNFIAGMCPLHTGYGPIRLYEPVNQSWLKWQKSWDGIFTRQYYGGVDFWLRQNAGAPMSPYPGLMRDTFKTLAERPSYQGIHIYGNQGYGHSGCYTWMVMKLMWNPTLDPYKLMDEYLKKAYGPAAPEMKALYDLAEKNMRKFITRRKGRFGYNCCPELLQEVYAADWEQYENLYLKALAKKKDPNQQWRLSMMGENLRLLRYHLVKSGLIEKTGSAKLSMTDAEFQEFDKRRLPGGDLYLYVNPRYTTSHMKRATVPISKVEIVRDIPNPEKMDGNSYFDMHKDFIVCAPRDMIAEFQLDWHTVKNQLTGKPYLPDTSYFSVLDQNRKPYYSGIADKGKISFPVRKGQFYYLFYTPLGDYAAQYRWKIRSANIPYAIGQRINATGIRFAWSKTTLYFKVRPGTQQFKMYFHGYGLDAVLVAPDGREYSTQKSNPNRLRYEVLTQNKPVPGWWRIRFRNKRGFHGTVRGSNDLDGFFVLDPEHALDVAIKR